MNILRKQNSDFFLKELKHDYDNDTLAEFEKTFINLKKTKNRAFRQKSSLLEVVKMLKHEDFKNKYDLNKYDYLRSRVDHEDNLFFGRTNAVLMVQSILLVGVLNCIITKNTFSLVFAWSLLISCFLGIIISFSFAFVGSKNIKLIRYLHQCISLVTSENDNSITREFVDRLVEKVNRSSPCLSFLTLYLKALYFFVILWLFLFLICLHLINVI